MTNRCETFRDYRTTIPVSSLNLYTIPCGFYGYQNEQNRMCKHIVPQMYVSQ